MYSNRWWESYLVRYFMPSIAGVAIVSWLVQVGGEDMRQALFFGHDGDDLSTPVLILLILYGNLFCYIASYPILGFHATRVIDQVEAVWRPSWLDGYVASVLLGAVSLLILLVPAAYRLYLVFLVVIVFAGLQLYRVLVSLRKHKIKGLQEDSALAYGYVHALAKRRGALERTRSESRRTGTAPDFSTEERSDQKVTHWHREVIETYRHMREHGNSAFIFFLELVLALICYVAVSAGGDVGTRLSVVAILFAIWALPAVSVHLLGQILERRFSQFDRRIRAE